MLLASIKLLSGGATTLTTLKNVYDNCSQHLFYKDDEGNLYETKWQGKWSTNKISGVSDIPKATSEPVACCTTSGKEYLYFISEGAVYRLTRKIETVTTKNSFGLWKCVNLSKILSLDVAPIGNLVCWITSGENIFFNSSNGHIHCIHRTFGGGWNYVDITNAGFAKLALIPGEKDEKTVDNIEMFEDYCNLSDSFDESDNCEVTEVSGNICGHVGIQGTQFIFYFGTGHKLYSLYWGPSLLNSSVDTNEDKDDKQSSLVEAPSKPVLYQISNKIQEVSRRFSSAIPKWHCSNISEHSHFSTINFYGSPTSHCTNIGSHHVFVIENSNFHLHEYLWHPIFGEWTHLHLTEILNLPKLCPSNLVSFASGRYHFCYFIDNEGNIHELRQNIVKNGPWKHCNITNSLSNLPLASDLLSATTFPLNKDIRANVIFFKDKAGHTIQVGCGWRSEGIHYSFEDLSVRSPIPKGGLSIITKGLIQSFCSQTESSFRQIFSWIGNLMSWDAKVEPDEEEDELARQLKHQLIKAERDAELLRNLKEANEQLAAQLMDCEIKMKEIEEKNENDTSEMLKLRTNFTEIEKSYEQSLRKEKELQKDLEKAAQDINIITDGMGIDAWKKYNFREVEREECCVCYEEPSDDVIFEPSDCGHKICTECFIRCENKCPICRC